MRGGAVALFYFSGHGLQVKGRNYLVPIGETITGDLDVDHEAVDAGRVLAKMAHADNAVNLVILDACRNNPFMRSFRSPSKGLATLDAPNGVLIAYAAAPGEVTSDNPSGTIGLYTTHLLKHLLRPGLKIEEVLKAVRGDVARETGRKQIPWESSSLIGDFYFVQAGSVPPTVSPPRRRAGAELTAEQYEAVWEDLLANLKRKKFSKKDTDAVLEKHGLTDADWMAANIKFGGMPARIRRVFENIMSPMIR